MAARQEFDLPPEDDDEIQADLDGVGALRERVAIGRFGLDEPPAAGEDAGAVTARREIVHVPADGAAGALS